MLSGIMESGVAPFRVVIFVLCHSATPKLKTVYTCVTSSLFIKLIRLSLSGTPYQVNS